MAGRDCRKTPLKAFPESAPYIAVLDGDMQHDESKLKLMLSTLKGGEEDFAFGSRYLADRGFGDQELLHKNV